MQQVSRYHPLLVTLHWLLAVLIIAALAIGFFVLAAMPNADPQKIAVLRVHMAGGMLILALMVIRFTVRMWTSRPAAATTGYPLLDRIAPITHYGFYVLVLLMVGSGYTTGILAGLPAIVFGGSAPRCHHLRDLSELCGTRLYCDDPCRLHRFARACRALPSIRYERRSCSGACSSGDMSTIPRSRRNDCAEQRCCTASGRCLGHSALLCRFWVTCGRRHGKNFLTLLQHWSGAVTCPAC